MKHTALGLNIDIQVLSNELDTKTNIVSENQIVTIKYLNYSLSEETNLETTGTANRKIHIDCTYKI